jgi:hypothetical protein
MTSAGAIYAMGVKVAAAPGGAPLPPADDALRMFWKHLCLFSSMAHG